MAGAVVHCFGASVFTGIARVDVGFGVAVVVEGVGVRDDFSAAVVAEGVGVTGADGSPQALNMTVDISNKTSILRMTHHSSWIARGANHGASQPLPVSA